VNYPFKEMKIAKPFIHSTVVDLRKQEKTGNRRHFCALYSNVCVFAVYDYEPHSILLTPLRSCKLFQFTLRIEFSSMKSE